MISRVGQARQANIAASIAGHCTIPSMPRSPWRIWILSQTGLCVSAENPARQAVIKGNPAVTSKPQVGCDIDGCPIPIELWWAIRLSSTRPWRPRAYCYEHGAQLFTIERIYYGDQNVTKLNEYRFS